MRNLEPDKLLKSLSTGFISNRIVSDNYLMPKLLVNNPQKQKKILSSIVDELSICEGFDFSVAFINDSGLASLMQTLDSLADIMRL